MGQHIFYQSFPKTPPGANPCSPPRATTPRSIKPSRYPGSGIFPLHPPGNTDRIQKNFHKVWLWRGKPEVSPSRGASGSSHREGTRKGLAMESSFPGKGKTHFPNAQTPAGFSLDPAPGHGMRGRGLPHHHTFLLIAHLLFSPCFSASV